MFFLKHSVVHQCIYFKSKPTQHRSMAETVRNVNKLKIWSRAEHEAA